jgi:tetratricopeptide (TPR) repeat protein
MHMGLAVRALGRRFLLPLYVAIGVGAVIVALIRVEASGQRDLDQARAALNADHPEEARPLLEQYLADRPNSAEAHFRAAQAAQRVGDLAAAERHLERAAALGWDASDIELERALIAAMAGQIGSAEGILLDRLAAGSPESSQILAVLLPAYAAEFRWNEAYTLTDQWVRLRPLDAHAWAWRGEVCERRRLRNEAVDALRESVRLDQNDKRVRLQLARLLLEVHQPGEAAGHLDWLRDQQPDDPAVSRQLALCREAQGAPDEAAALLDRVIAADPTGAAALRDRGRLELNRGRPEAAVPFLRQAVDRDLSDPDALNSLAIALQQTGATEEARAIEERRQRTEADLKKVGELVRLIAASPHDADLRREVGELFLRNGRDQDGLRWLESALREQSDHAATHCLLADYFERKGRKDDAAAHRRFCPKGQ